jgi:ankyrin repeat protein
MGPFCNGEAKRHPHMSIFNLGERSLHALKMLLEFPGILINARGGDPPLCQAVEKGSLKAVQLLVNQGEKLLVNERTCMNRDTALCIAARHGNVEIVRALSQHLHLNPNLENHHSEHPLFLAAKRRNVQVVSALLEDSRLLIRSMKDAVSWTRKGLVRSTIQHQIDLQKVSSNHPKNDTVAKKASLNVY